VYVAVPSSKYCEARRRRDLCLCHRRTARGFLDCRGFAHREWPIISQDMWSYTRRESSLKGQVRQSVGRPALLVIHGHPAAKAIQNTLSFGSQLSTSPTSDLASNPSRNAGLLVGTSGLTLGLGTGCLSAKTIRRDVLGSPIRHATGLEEGWEVRPLRSFGIRSSTVPARVSQSRSR